MTARQCVVLFFKSRSDSIFFKAWFTFFFCHDWHYLHPMWKITKDLFQSFGHKKPHFLVSKCKIILNNINLKNPILLTPTQCWNIMKEKLNTSFNQGNKLCLLNTNTLNKQTNYGQIGGNTLFTLQFCKIFNCQGA